MIRKFRIVGTTYKNEDGTERQYLLRKLKYREDMFECGLPTLHLKKYYYNGSPAIGVYADSYQLGNLSAKDAAEIFQKIPDECPFIIDIYGGGTSHDTGEKKNFGAEITLIIPSSRSNSKAALRTQNKPSKSCEEANAKRFFAESAIAAEKAKKQRLIAFYLVLAAIVLTPVCAFISTFSIIGSVVSFVIVAGMYYVAYKLWESADDAEATYLFTIKAVPTKLKVISILITIVLTILIVFLCFEAIKRI